MNLQLPFSRLSQRKGATLADFGIIVGLVAVLAIGTVFALGDQIRNAFSTTNLALAEGPAVSSTPATVEAPPPVVTPDPITVGATAPTLILDNVSGITLPLPEVSNDNAMVAFVLHRYPINPPAGWTLLASQDPALVDISGFTTYLSAFFAPTGASTEPTFTQGGTGRMSGQVLALEGSNPTVLRSDGTAGGTDTNAITFPGAAPDALVLSARANRFALTGGAGTSATAPDGWSLTTPAFIEGNRLFVAHRTLDVHEAGTNLPMPSFITNNSTFDYAQITLQFAPDGTQDVTPPPTMPTVRAAGALVFDTPVSTLVARAPQSTQPGDLLVAFVAHRDTLITPAGWMLQRTRRVGTSTSTNAQYTSVLTKSASGGAETVTFTQESPLILHAQIVAVAGVNPQVTGLWSAWGNNPSTVSSLNITMAMTETPALMLYAYSDIFAASTGETTHTAAGWTPFGRTSFENLRLSTGWKSFPAGATTPEPYPPVVTNVSSKQWGMVVLRITQ